MNWKEGLNNMNWKERPNNMNWKEKLNILKEQGIEEAIETKSMTIKQAVELSIVKWAYIVEDPSIKDQDDKMPGLEILDELECFCALCEYDSYVRAVKPTWSCANCPLNTIADEKCGRWGSIYQNFDNAESISERKTYAIELFDVLEELLKRV